MTRSIRKTNVRMRIDENFTRELISVIIPTYNRAKYVVQAIDSVLSQTYKDYEIIVVDDGSTDDTKEVLEPYKDRISYMYQENAGVSAARNAGIRAAKGEWIAFLDSDDVWHPAKLKTQIKSLEKYPSAVLLTCNVDLANYVKSKATAFSICGFHSSEQVIKINSPFKFHLKYSTVVMPPAVICKRDVALKVKGFDCSLSLYEDYHFMCKFSTQGEWVIVNELLLSVNKTTGNLSDARTDQIFKHECMAKAHQYLIDSGLLTPSQKCLIKALLAKNYKEIARQYYKKANETSFSILNLLIYYLSRVIK